MQSLDIALEALSGGLEKLLPVLDLVAAAVFAITGALVASRKQMDIVGFMWLAVVTGVGGGTVRDLLLDLPVFWVSNAAPVIVCVVVAIITYFTAHLANSRYRLILRFDAIGLALVTVAGAAKGLDAGASPFVAVVMGVITGTLGGIIRDVLGNEPSVILRREIYVTASLVGATLFVLLEVAGVGRMTAALAGGTVVAAIRYFAILYGWSMPSYRARPGRPAEEVDGTK